MSRYTAGMFLAFASALLVMVIAGCGEKSTSRPRALLIGIDGMSPRITVPMIEQGRLPNLRAIAEQGVSGKLRAPKPLWSPRIWNIIATGRLSKDHGVIGYLKQSSGDEPKRPFRSDDRVVPALWNILSEQGLRVGVVNWWTSYPPEKIDGVMVSDHFFFEETETPEEFSEARGEPPAALLHPESWSGRAEVLLEGRDPLVRIKDPFEGNTALPSWVDRDFLSEQYQTDIKITRISLGLLKDHQPDLMMVYLPGVDRVSHWLWGNLEPEHLYPEPLRPTPEARKAGAEALHLYYEFADELVGQLVKSYAPDDLVMVVSDHGFEGGVRMLPLTGEHVTRAAVHGVIFAKGRGIPRDDGAGEVSVYDVAPSLLAWLGLPVALDMFGEPAPFLSISSPRKVASYDDIEVERVPARESGHEAEIVEQLRALGYLEDD